MNQESISDAASTLSVQLSEPLGGLVGGLFGGIMGGVGGGLGGGLAWVFGVAFGPIGVIVWLILTLGGSFLAARHLFGRAAQRRRETLRLAIRQIEQSATSDA